MRMPFGLFKGKPLEEVDRDYLRWLRGAGFAKEPLKTAIEVEWERREALEHQTKSEPQDDDAPF